jgi:hypothetical protein
MNPRPDVIVVGDPGPGGPVLGGTVKDMAFVGITVVFFVLSWLYVRGCARV